MIELQQQELNKRSAAVETRAADIATSFSTAIATFEQRLLKLEGGVQSDLQLLRSDISDKALVIVAVFVCRAPSYKSIWLQMTDISSRLQRLEEAVLRIADYK